MMENSLKEIKNSLKGILDKFVFENKVNPNGTYVISKLNNIRFVLIELSKLKLFDTYLNRLLGSIIFTSSQDSMTVQSIEANEIIYNLKNLKDVSENFLSVLIRTIPEEDPNSINIKLPTINDFDELSNVARSIHIALTQVVLDKEIDGHTKIVSVENGSIWFNVFVGSTAITLVASLAWSAAVIYKKIQEGRLLEEQIRSMKIKNESLTDILKAQKADTDLMIIAEAENILSNYFKQNVPENLERIKNSIKIFAELIDKGAEIHPALIAPEKVSNLFPDTKNLLGIESKIKKLTNPIGE